MSRGGLPEMERAVDSIRVGRRLRATVGDVDALCESIRRFGLLQPITISPDGTLICGARRLDAVKRLGHRTIKVWVRSGISEGLERLLAEQHENILHTPLSATEAEALYREMKQYCDEEAALRQQATRFGAETSETAGHDGAVQWTAPGDAREQAALLVTGKKSHNRLERVGALVDLSKDPTAPEHLRRLAEEALTAIDADDNVYGHYATVKAAEAYTKIRQIAADETRPAGMRQRAASEADKLLTALDGLPSHEVLKQCKKALHTITTANRPAGNKKKEPNQPAGSRRLGVQAFVTTWSELHGWTEYYDPAEIAAKLTSRQWTEFDATVTATVAFSDAVRQVRGRTDATTG